jgi:hypothetical protein
MPAPYYIALDRVSKSNYLTGVPYSDPITKPFGLNVWTPDRKVLNAYYSSSDVEIVSFYRGEWEHALISAAAHIDGSVLQIEPTEKRRSTQADGSARPFTDQHIKWLWDNALLPKFGGLLDRNLLRLLLE